jgi:hypothetical protein
MPQECHLRWANRGDPSSAWGGLLTSSVVVLPPWRNRILGARTSGGFVSVTDVVGADDLWPRSSGPRSGGDLPRSENAVLDFSGPPNVCSLA